MQFCILTLYFIDKMKLDVWVPPTNRQPKYDNSSLIFFACRPRVLGVHVGLFCTLLSRQSAESCLRPFRASVMSSGLQAGNVHGRALRLLLRMPIKKNFCRQTGCA